MLNTQLLYYKKLTTECKYFYPRLITYTLTSIIVILFYYAIYTNSYLFSEIRAHPYELPTITLLKYQIFASIIYLVIYVVFIRNKINNSINYIFLGIILLFIVPLSIFTKPIHSQDEYLILAFTKGYSSLDINPYSVTINDLPDLEVKKYVHVWRDVNVMYGPITIFIYYIPSLFNNIQFSLLSLKFFSLISIIISVFLLAKYLKDKNYDDDKIADIILLFLVNPFIYFNALIDTHNDIFMMPLILMGFIYYTRRNTIASLYVISIAVLIKYVPFILFPVIFYREFTSVKNINKKIITILIAITLCILNIIVFFSFFFEGKETFKGLYYQLNIPLSNNIDIGYYFTYFLGIDKLTFKLMGFIISALIAIYLSYKNKLPHSFTYPFIFVFLFVATYFQGWYVLWIFPLLFIIFPFSTILIITVALVMISSIFTPLQVSAYFFVAIIINIAYLNRKELYTYMQYITHKLFHN